MAYSWRLLLHAFLCGIAGLTSGTIQAEQAPVLVHIELRPDVAVSEQFVTVADIAAVNANNFQVKKMLEVLRVRRAPLVGYVERLSREEVERVIRTHLKDLNSTLEWGGAKTVKIQSAGRRLNADVVVSAAQKYLLEQLCSRFQNADVQLASPIADVELPFGELLLKPRAIDVKHVYSRLPVWIDVYVNGVPYRSVVVPFTVKADQSVYLAKRDLPEGTTVTTDDFELRTKEILANANDWMPELAMQGPIRLKKRLMAGQVLMRNHVSQNDMVFRGDPVKLVLTEGGVMVEAFAQVQQEAVIGQLVRVKIEKGIDTIVGRLIAPGVVKATGK